MSAEPSTPDRTFVVQGDGRYRGDDGASGDLAGMTLYVVRALAQIDGLLGVGAQTGFDARGGSRELRARIDHDGDFGVEVVCELFDTGREAHQVAGQPLGATMGNELEHVMDLVTQVDLVAGCFVVSANGNLLADRVPGVDREAMAGTGRRMKVAYDAFDRFLSSNLLVATFTWAQLVAAPVGNGIAVAIADLDTDLEELVTAVHVGGGVLTGVDLATVRQAIAAE